MSTPIERPVPSTAAIAIATAILAALAGYFIGQASSLGLFGSVRKSSEPKSSRRKRVESSSDEGEDDIELEEEGDGELEESAELKEFPGNREECKLVLVVRTDLGMTKGKIAAQCSHATLACYKNILRKSPNSRVLQRWERGGQAKVALQVRSEDELEMLQARAISLGLCAQMIHDQGRTQIAAGSATVLGVGPAPKSRVDEVTGHLKLL